MTAGGVQFGVDVVIDPTKAKQGGSGVEDALKRIERQAERTNRLLARGMTRQSRDMNVLRESLQNVNTRTRTVTKSTTQMGAALKKTGEEGELSLERLIKGQVSFNAKTLASISSIVLMGSLGSKAMASLGSAVEKGYGQIARLGKAWRLARQTGDWGAEDLDPLALERAKAEGALANSIKAQGQSSNRKAYEGALNMVSAVVAGENPFDGSNTVDPNTAAAIKSLAAVEQKERAVNAAIKEGVPIIEARMAAAKRLEDVQELGFKQRMANAREESRIEFEMAGSKDATLKAEVSSLLEIRRRGDITKAQFDDEMAHLKAISGRREADSREASARADERKREREQALAALVATVGSLDKEYAARVRIYEVQKQLNRGVKDFELPQDRANELLQKQRDILFDDLNPAWVDLKEKVGGVLGLMRDVGGDALDVFRKPAASLGKVFEPKESEKKSSPLADYLTDLRDVQSTMETGLVNAAQELESALVRAFTSGDQSASDFLRSLAAIGVQMGLRGLVGSAIPGKQTGGSFMVGGGAGVDKTPVMFMASRGERVTVDTPGRAAQGGGSGGGPSMPPVINNNVVVSAQDMAAVLSTPQGQRELFNAIRVNRDALLRALR